MIVEALKLGCNPGRCRRLPIRWGEQIQQMMERRPHLLHIGSARRWAGARRQVMQQEALDEGSIDIRDTQAFVPHPVAEMREATQISAEGASGIAPVLQRLDVQSEEFIQRAFVRQSRRTRCAKQRSVGMVVSWSEGATGNHR